MALNKVISVAPLSAGTLIEKGYILSQLKQNDLAYNTYEEAYKMTTAYKSQLPFQAAALRGMGSNLIDLNKLDDAEEKFNLSLKVDPDNSTALSELKYISSLRNKQK